MVPYITRFPTRNICVGSVPQKELNMTTNTDTAVLNEQDVRDKLGELRKLHGDNMTADKAGRDQLAATQAERLLNFLKEGYPQARELIDDKNRKLLNSLVREHDLPARTSVSGLMEHIANLQMGDWSKDGKTWVTPARRNERVGKLYRIFHEKNLSTAEMVKAIAEAGGTSAIIAKDIKDSVDPALAKRIEQRAKLAYADREEGALRPFEDVTPKNTGEWRLALVSVHEDGVVVRSIVGKKDDAATIKARDAFAKERADAERLASFKGGKGNA
jgi:hypothetical protein